MSANKKQGGSFVVTFALSIIVLLCFTVVVVDVGRALAVRNELQNAADAAALAGAMCLDRVSAGGGTTCTSVKSPTINWAMGTTKATNSIGLNNSESTALADIDTVNVGYWNLLNKAPSGGTWNTGFTPLTINDKPAVQVTVSRKAGKNGGLVKSLLGSMFGTGDIQITTVATAVISSPGSVVPGSLIPQAINKCMFDLYWDSTTNLPRLATSTTALNGVTQVVGKPYQLRMGSSYHYGTCDSGQWTTFGQDTTDTPTVRTLIAGGNPTNVAISPDGSCGVNPITCTLIESGTVNTLYAGGPPGSSLDDKYPTPVAPTPLSSYVSDAQYTNIALDTAVAVVDMSAGGLNGPPTLTPIVAFACWHIDDIQGSSSKYIEGHFSGSCIIAASSSVGPSYGTYTPPRLAQ
jgi:Flp pilus assembly protein TadG